MVDIQKQLLEETEFGRQLKETVSEMETAQKSLQEAGQGLTREKLLDIVLQSPSDARLKAYVSLARGGMDYQFFQLLTEKIDKASADEAGGNTRWTPAYMRMAAPDRVEPSFVHDMLEARLGPLGSAIGHGHESQAQ